jgi:hypothetical protein
MPRDERKHQKAIMKKRNKEKAAAQHRGHQQSLMPASPQTIIQRARTYPILECWISKDWQGEMELVQVVVARQQPDGNVCFGTYLVDKLCLGIKNTFANAGFSHSRYEREVVTKTSQRTKLMKCSPELAHQIIYGSIDFAAQFGFKPQQDFALSQLILAPRGELDEPYQITYGRNGKPFFVSGPYDNVDRILKQLEKTAGPGNFDFLMMVGEV